MAVSPNHSYAKPWLRELGFPSLLGGSNQASIKRAKAVLKCQAWCAPLNITDLSRRRRLVACGLPAWAAPESMLVGFRLQTAVGALVTAWSPFLGDPLRDQAPAGHTTPNGPVRFGDGIWEPKARGPLVNAFLPATEVRAPLAQLGQLRGMERVNQETRKLTFCAREHIQDFACLQMNKRVRGASNTCDAERLPRSSNGPCVNVMVALPQKQQFVTAQNHYNPVTYFPHHR